MNIKKLRNRKIFILIFLVVCTGVVVTFLPSLARVQNRTPLDTSTVWDGGIATSYRKGSGTESDPYIIASGKELSYFSTMLKTTNYEGKYFALSNDIILNNGVFSYDEGAKYTLNKSTFFLNREGDFFDNAELSGTKIGSVNSLESLDNFKGHFDGKSYTIYGLYISSETLENALFTNLEGEVKNLYVANALIEGGVYTGGIASTASNASILNVSFQGQVVGDTEAQTDTEVLSIENVDYTKDTGASLNIPLRQKFGNIESAILSGCCSSSFRLDGKNIECSENTFTTELSTTYKNILPIDADDSLSLTNLSLELTYKIGYAGGLIGVGSNVAIENSISKGYVASSNTAGGLIGLASKKVDILNSYNKASVEAPNHSGLIGVIENIDSTSTINHSYNGVDNTGFVGAIYNSSNNVKITNSFEAGKYYAFIQKIKNSKVIFENVYSVGTNTFQEEDVDGSVTNITIDSLKDKDFLTNTLSFNEFKDLEDLNVNTGNVWTYEQGFLPTLYIDDIQNPIANLNVGTYSWNNLGFDDAKINFASNVAFSIDEISNVKPIKEAYYFISNSSKPLTRDEINSINWLPYEGIMTLESDGFYTIYAKVIDNNDYISYINSNILVIDKTGSEVSIKGADKLWNTRSDVLEYTYIDTPTSFQIEAIDEYSGVKSIEYATSNIPLSNEDLNSRDWVKYDKNITLEDLGTKIIYVKVTDNAGNITYVNSGYIVYAGYTLTNLGVGNTGTYIKDITNNSKVVYNFTYSDQNTIDSSSTHHLVSNVLLPKSTKITLKDNIKNKVYTYLVQDDTSSIPFTEFEEIGKGNMQILFKEEFNDIINEDYTVTLDFKNALFKEDILGLNIFVELHDSDGNISRSTVKNTLKDVNIYLNSYSVPNITSTYTGDSIIFNSDSISNIDLTTSLKSHTIDDIAIYDSSYDNKKMGIEIKLIDDNNKTVEKKYLKNIRFKLGDNYYSPNDDGITRIKVSDDRSTTSSSLVILTSRDTITLKEGTYYLNITSFASYDGIYGKDYSKEKINIPVVVGKYNDVISDYKFSVLPDKDYKVLWKKDNNINLGYRFNFDDGYSNPSIRITLYKKSKLTAYDQTYKLVDLIDYTNTPLERVLESTYQVPAEYVNTTDKFNLYLDLNKLESGGYKFNFELYDGSKRIGSIENKFIVR